MRTRSEYRLSPLQAVDQPWPDESQRPNTSHRDDLAAALLAGYRNTIDDEGEDLDDALAAIDHYLGVIETEHSVVLFDGEEIIAFSFVLMLNEVPYIDPVVVAPPWKRRGLGTTAVRCNLGSLHPQGHSEVGATITDGNTASERLFAQLGFTRRGPWPPRR